MNRIGRIALKTLIWIVGTLIGLLVLLILIIRIPTVQNYVVGKVSSYLEQKIGTPVDIGNVYITFPKKLLLQNIYIEDQTKDTLIAGEKLLVDINMFKLLKNTVEIEEIELKGITTKIKRTLPDSTFNFDYIIQAFNSEKESSASADTTSALVFDIDKVSLDNIHAIYDDAIIGTRAEVRLKHFDTNLKRFDLTGNMAFAMPKIKVEGFTALINQWQPAQASDAPAASHFGVTDRSVETTSMLPDIDISNIDLVDISLNYQNTATGLKTTFDLKKFATDIKLIDLNKSIVELGELMVDRADADIIMDKISTPKIESASSDTSSANWTVSASRLLINDTNIGFKDKGKAPTKGFDYANISITELTGQLDDFYYRADSISGSLHNLSAKEHSGLDLLKARASFVYSDTKTELTDLLLQTPKTIIRDHIKITYPTLSALTHSPDKVNVNVNLTKSTIYIGDVLLFAPFLASEQSLRPLLAQSFYIDGTVNGNLSNLLIPRLEVKTASRTHLIAKATLKGLPDLKKTYIDLQLNKFTTGRKDIQQLVSRTLLPPNIKFPESIRLNGFFKGGLNGFATRLNLGTDLGNALVSGNLKIEKDTSYNARIKIDGLDIGNILKQDSTMGKLSADADIAGVGLDPRKMNTKIAATIHSFNFKGYNYQNVTSEVLVDHGLIKGWLDSPDPNARLNLNFNANLSTSYPSLKANLKVDSVNLQNLRIVNEDIRYRGQLQADFDTADPDNLNGTALISGSYLAYKDTRYALDSILLTAKSDKEQKLLTLQSDIVKAHLVGNYKLTELGKSFQQIISSFYNNGQAISQNPVAITPQQFEFSAKLSQTPLIKSFLPKLTDMHTVTLDGTFDSRDHNMQVKLNVPLVRYDNMLIQRLGVEITTADSALYYSATVQNAQISSFQLNNTLLSGRLKQNQADIKLWIKDKADSLQYALASAVQIAPDAYDIRLMPDSLVLNYETWTVAPSNHIRFSKAGLYANDFNIINQAQELSIQSADSTANSPLTVSFSNFKLPTLTRMVTTDSLGIEGTINGKATISELQNNPTVVADLLIEQFTYAKQPVGDISVKVNNEQQNIYALDIDVTGQDNNVQLSGTYSINPTGESQIDADLRLQPLTVRTLQAFSMGALGQSTGELTGNLKINGTPNAPQLNGEIAFQDVNLNVAMINADFSLDQQIIRFAKDAVHFDNFEITDAKGHPAIIDGKIGTSSFSDLDFGLQLRLDDFEAVNSTREDNDLFFGKLYLSCDLNLTGNMNLPRLDGNIRVEDSTDFSLAIPNKNPGVVEREGVVDFVDRRDTLFAQNMARLDSLTTLDQLAGLDIAINLSTDPEAKFNIILDEGTQDALHIQGVAEINASIDASNKISLSGTYSVEQGSYTFSLGPISRPFTFQKGSTITFNGDPLDGSLDITAVYTNKFPTLELVQPQIGSENPNLYKQRLPFDVKLILSGELLKPEIAFDIDMNEEQAVASQDVVSKVNIALSSLKEDPSELNKQVFALIALGRFMSANPFESLSGGGGVEGIARSTVSSFLTSQLNNLASDLIKGVELDFNLQSEEDYLTGNAQTRTDLNVGVSKLLFDNRLKVTIGSNFEVEGNSRPGEKSTNIAGDIALDYQLSSDGRYIARVYRKNQYQATLQGQFIETGIGFIMNRDYNYFRQLFIRSKAKNIYNTDKRSFKRRFDVKRMGTDSVYRDSVRTLLRDSVERKGGDYRKPLGSNKLSQLNVTSKSNREGAQDTLYMPKKSLIREEELNRR
ncbi:Family of unknown function [Sphingobacterium nematocida]|uniref:Translocation and assembly module TamB C-terminal domain-containing protein n=1 Tax=Sphingobacterium nematocida TaxID=1513896 RepID=A0A1T5BPZ1_9SPHI|nr:Family of unknown function [Sphingobacterium nematocida]